MSELSKVETGKKAKPRRCLMYGVDGIGKTTWASKAPNAIIVQCEEGSDDIDCKRFPFALDYDHVIRQLMELYSDDHGFNTVVIDTVDWLERMIHAKVCEEYTGGDVSNIAEIGYANGYKLALTQWEKLLNGLTALRESRNMNIILLAHAQVISFKEPGQESYDKYAPRLDKNVMPILKEWCDEVLFANHEIATVTQGESFGSKTYRGVATGQRIVHSSPSPGYMAKCRIELPEQMSINDHDVYFKHFIKTEIKTTKKDTGK